MNVELEPKDIVLLNMMLNKELGDTRVEARHSDNREYKNCLKEREKQLKSLVDQFSKIPVPEIESKC
jgi:hypothetical protein